MKKAQYQNVSFVSFYVKLMGIKILLSTEAESVWYIKGTTCKMCQNSLKSSVCALQSNWSHVDKAFYT